MKKQLDILKAFCKGLGLTKDAIEHLVHSSIELAEDFGCQLASYESVDIGHYLPDEADLEDGETECLYPDFGNPLLLGHNTIDNYNLEKYPEEGEPNFIGLNYISVQTERDKQQILNASKYFHDMHELDTDYYGPNLLAHLYTTPHLIKVETS